MAIVIPSKNIYSDPINAKIRDNLIDKVTSKFTQINPDNEYQTPIHNETIYLQSSDKITAEGNSDKKDFVETIGKDSAFGFAIRMISASYLDSQLGYFSKNIKIKRNRDNKFITKLSNSQDTNVIGISLRGKIITETASATITTQTGSTVENATMSEIKYSNKQETTGVIEMPPLPIVVTTMCEEYSNLPVRSEVVGITGQTTFEITYDDDYIYVNLKILLYSMHTSLSGISKPTYTIELPSVSVELNGNKETYVANEVELTVYGNTIGISLTDGTITYGSGNNPHSLDGNELIQDGTTTNGVLTTELLADKILSQYKNGKETAKLKCSIGEYKDEQGNVVISEKLSELPMTFNEGDLVIPMKFSNNGDIPMSKYKDGNAKIFEVVKTNFIYDGAVWQELTLQEHTKEN